MTGKRVALLAGALVLLVAVAVVGVGVGAHAIAPVEVVRALLDHDGSSDHVVVRDIRVPRAVLAVGAGAALAVSGVLIQVLSRNPLAEPGVLGVTAGAGFAMAAGSALGLAASPVGELLLAVVGAVLATLLVYSVGRRSPLRLVLTGVALSAVLTGVTLGLRLVLPDVFDKYRFWSVGSLAGREQAPNAVPLLVIAVALVCALLLSRQLDAVALGDTVAHALGANVARVRLASLVLITVLAGAATAVAGPILFVGLIVPHVARRLAGASVPWLIGFAAVLGPVLLLVADVGSRVLLPTGEVPVAIVTAFLGGPVLIWAARRYGAVPA
ncbi:FecCD family ABC transporter permease [Saccharothrix algeriensis]|uniref:Iron chelate uptake ABC transporter family permease subunit n=1 Tax=Saccharothrix algeriensis TaxID=173560 RepID=A0A8T8I051_9PSEU|nr:iron chelate uptake ABC transporter family permease subunit [Saccharothrix algeriensis]MBM7815113.1 iron complex transport system permease protein [Saccharothrix algeriensis]QTR03364.1 iron chelate uptake ABC transporter family permease subunit [Saccharothrix algeriensis]